MTKCYERFYGSSSGSNNKKELQDDFVDGDNDGVNKQTKRKDTINKISNCHQW
jgi:hypothetical protein